MLKALQGIVVSRQTSLRIWEMTEKENKGKDEITLNNSAMVMLCGFKIWFNSQILTHLFDLIENSAFEFFRTF